MKHAKIEIIGKNIKATCQMQSLEITFILVPLFLELHGIFQAWEKNKKNKWLNSPHK